MGLRAALVDQGYLHRGSKALAQIGGRALSKDSEGPMFKARLDLSTAPEQEKDGRVQTTPRPTLLTATKDSDGNKLEFRSSDTIRVVSRELGEATWEVEGDPEPLRKRRSLIGWQLMLIRVHEQDEQSDEAI